MQLVWFKRDLRVVDHEPLMKAAQMGLVLPLYIVEPNLWKQPDLSGRHYAFLQDCLSELAVELERLGLRLHIRVGEAVDVLQSIQQEQRIDCLWSHQETWNGWTYQRDLRVGAWAQEQGVVWHEPSQNGVIRRLANRNGWASSWTKRMRLQQEVFQGAVQAANLQQSDSLPSPQQLGLFADACPGRQRGGRSLALQDLNTFLNERGEFYTQAMSSPNTAFDSCSRISTHLAFGVLSMREVFHISEAHAAALKRLPAAERGKWPSAMRSFLGRLRWHCHFIQKLEDEPRIEFENMHPSYDGLREGELNADYFNAWKTGQTGYPMVDACMRALLHTGWLNFRMRAMVMSFASYHLWLHWREPALYLARLFTDYEPGIHYSQVQMQSGTTGINSIRIYNPIKQGLDHDPEGVFVRQWVPELCNMPTSCIHTPWLMPDQMNGYPMPIVDEKQARKAAAAKMHGVRKQADHREQAEQIVEKHGSRKRDPSLRNEGQSPSKAQGEKQPAGAVQMEFQFDSLG